MIERRDAPWKRAAKWFLETQAAYEEAKGEIIRLSKQQCCYGAGVKHERKLQAGRISYKDVPELQGVDLSEYRGKSYYKTEVSKI